MQITRGVIPSAQKCVVYGPEGIGKSTFASQFPNPVFIDTEGSTKHMDVARTPKPSSWTMLLDQVRYFRDTPGGCGSLVIDTADWAEQLCVTHVCAAYQKTGIEEFGFGKGYTYLSEEFGKLLNLLEEVVERGIHVVLTAHAKMRKFEQPDELGSYDRWEMKLGKNTAPLVKEWADLVLFAKYKIHVINVDNQGAQKGKNKAQGGKRVMMTSHNPCWDAKNRHGLPEELPFSYTEIAHCFAKPEEVPSAPPITPPSILPPPPESPKKPTEPSGVPVEAQGATGEWPPTDKNLPDTLMPPIDPHIPKALRDLMLANQVTEKELQEAVVKRGYYPANTPITNYGADFIQGVLIAAWPQIVQFIEENVRDLPF